MEGKQKRKNALNEFVAFVQHYAAQHRDHSKEAVTKAVAQQFQLRADRKVYVGAEFVVRFCWSSKESFPGTVLGLSILRKYDHVPAIVCVVRPTRIELLLANSTLIDKISHSSHRLASDRVRGSFNGSNIIRNFDNLDNTPENFHALFDRHLQIGFEENYARIVENTLAIRARLAQFTPSTSEQTAILAAAGFAEALCRDSEYLALATRLAQTVDQNRDAILAVATSDNVNLRGNAIEQIVTRAGNLHTTGDVAEKLMSGVTVHVDIKTKLIEHFSSPAAYNIDKLLRLLARGKAAFSFLLIGIDLSDQTVSTRMVSFLDTTILDATRIQPHWAGRNSRGGTQLTGALSAVLAQGFQETIDVSKAGKFLQRLIDI